MRFNVIWVSFGFGELLGVSLVFLKTFMGFIAYDNVIIGVYRSITGVILSAIEVNFGIFKESLGYHFGSGRELVVYHCGFMGINWVHYLYRPHIRSS